MSLAAEWREKQTISVSNADNACRSIHCCPIPLHFDTQKQKLLIIQEAPIQKPLNETEMITLQEAVEERVKAHNDSVHKTLERLQKEISERKTIEKQLQVSNLQLELIMRQLPGILWTSDLQLKVTFYRGAENIFPQFPEIEGASVYDIFAFSPVLELAIRSHLMAISGEKLHFEYPFAGRTYEVSLEPMRDEKGALIGCIALALDISQRKREELEMKDALEKANELNELKNRFIAMASHEFRTPLSAILLSSQMLRRNLQNWEPEKKDEYFNRIEQAVQRLTETVEDIILIGKADYEQRNITPQKVHLESFVQEILIDLQCTFHEYSLDIRSEKSFSQEYACFEPHIVRIALTNVLSNAVKYSGFSEPVFLTASCTSSELRFIIEDKGIGIAEKDLDKIFEPFYRCNNVQKIKGSGLGLTIVKKMIELINGDIQIQSQEGKGSVVCLTFPLIS
jgi:signal transduction histidine kinase